MSNNCYVCGAAIHPDRVEALTVLEVPTAYWTCFTHANNQKVKGVYLGESGVSPMIFASDVRDEPVKFDYNETIAPENEEYE